MKLKKLRVVLRHPDGTEYTQLYYVSDDTDERGVFRMLHPDGTAKLYHPNQEKNLISYEAIDLDDDDKKGILEIIQNSLAEYQKRVVRLTLIKQVLEGNPSEAEIITTAA